VATSEISDQLIIAHANSERETHYQIRSILGEGGSGITYCAQVVGSDRQVALKELSLQKIKDWKAIELFEREAQVLAQLNHPAIPKYIDYFTIDIPDNRSFYIVQELAPGKTLQAWLQEGWRGTEVEVKDIARQILEILIYLQQLNPPVIHRDIKPSNILRTATGQLSLVDFGAVQQTYHDTFMRGSTVVGTYGYMAPEQFRGQSLPATDLYGLGATILTLLTNRSPAELSSDNLKINFRNKIKVSDGFADWLEKMLEPDAADRFPSATMALAALQKPFRSRVRNPWEQMVAVVFFGILAVSLLNNYKYYFLGLWGFTPAAAFTAIWQQGDVEKVRSLLDRGISANARDANGSSLLHYAVTNNRLEIAKLLIDRGADVNAHYDRDGHTVLHLAVFQPDGKMTKLLLNNKADPNIRDNFTFTPLHVYILGKAVPYNTSINSYYGFSNVDMDKKTARPIQYLLEYGAQVNAVTTNSTLLKTISDQEGMSWCGTPLDLANASDQTQIPLLIDAGGRRSKCNSQTLECKLD
jgi:serine/threonine protein kinase